MNPIDPTDETEIRTILLPAEAFGLCSALGFPIVVSLNGTTTARGTADDVRAVLPILASAEVVPFAIDPPLPETKEAEWLRRVEAALRGSTSDFRILVEERFGESGGRTVSSDDLFDLFDLFDGLRNEAEAAYGAILRNIEESDDGFECCDNFRMAVVGDPLSEAAFALARSQGCCGSEEWIEVVEGRAWRLGFNYGH